MRSRIPIAVAVLSFAATGLNAQESSLTRSLDARYAQMKRAIHTHDGLALRNILAPGFVSVELDGKTESVDQMIQEVNALPSDANRSSETTLLSVRPSNAQATVDQRYTMKTKKEGKDGIEHDVKLVTVSTDTWIMLHRKWYIQRTVTDQLDYYIDGRRVLHQKRSGVPAR
jgi:hypothetical protein